MQPQVSTVQVIVNGQRCAPEQAVVPLTSRAFNYGDGIFETMRLLAGGLPLQLLHKQRLLHGVKVLGLQLSVDIIDALFEQIVREFSCFSNGIVKLVLARGECGVAGYVTENQFVNSYIQFTPCSQMKGWLQEPVHLYPAAGTLSHNSSLAGLKHLNRLDYIVACGGRAPTSDEECLFLDKGGNIIETMRHNIFCVLGDLIYTPSIANVGVAGVMRQLIIDELSISAGVRIIEESIAYNCIAQFDEVFLSNAVRGIVPVASVERGSTSQHSYAQRFAQGLMEKYPDQKEVG